MIAGLRDEAYVVSRSEAIERATKSANSARTVVVDARLGNGKTIFLNLLGAALSAQGYKCFMCRSNAESAARDLEALAALGKVAIFFDSYGLALDLIGEFASLKEAVFAVAVRTSVRAVQMHEILARFPGPVSTVSVNPLQSKDRRSFSNLVSRAGLLTADFDRKVVAARDFRELVLTVFDNAQIKSSIQREIIPIINNQKVRSLFLARSGHEADPAFLRDVTGLDPYETLVPLGSAIPSFCEIKESG